MLGAALAVVLRAAAEESLGDAPLDAAPTYELAAFPISGQVNGLWTRHWGSGLAAMWHPQPLVGLRLNGHFNWDTGRSSFDAEVPNTYRMDVGIPARLLLVWALTAGVEVAPISGYVSAGGWRGRFETFIEGHLGVADFRNELQPESKRADGTVRRATFGDLGVEPVMGLGLSMRVQLARQVWLRVELGDDLHQLSVTRVNGCSAGDLRTMDGALRQGLPPDSVAGDVSRSCSVASFTGDYPESGQPPVMRSNDVPLALSLVRLPTNDWVHLVTAQVGVSVAF